MVGSRGSAPTGRFTYTIYRLPTGTLTVNSRPLYSLNLKLIRAGCGTHFRGMRSLTFAACGQKTVIFHYFHNLPLSQKLDPRLTDTSYEQLKYHSVLWFCSCFGLPNYSNCLFPSNISNSNPYSVLDTPADSSRDNPNMSEEPSTTFAPNPANTSTPQRKNGKPNLN